MKRDNDPAKSTEGKIQRILRKLKDKLSSKEYISNGFMPWKVLGHRKIP